MNLIEDKNLIFLEKDNENANSKFSIDSAKFFLTQMLGLPKERVELMVIYYEFNSMDSDELMQIMFNPSNIIVSYSVYVSGSDILFRKYMASVGCNNIKGLTYIDTSGELGKYLDLNLSRIEKGVYDIICAINSNNIISINYRSNIAAVPQLIKVQLNGRYDKCVVYKDLIDENIIRK